MSGLCEFTKNVHHEVKSSQTCYVVMKFLKIRRINFVNDK